MSVIFLVSEHIAKTTGLVNKEHPYIWNNELYYEAQEYSDGAHPVNSDKFCLCCCSNNCKTA